MVRTNPLGRGALSAVFVAMVSASLGGVPVLAQAEAEAPTDPAPEPMSEAWPAAPLPGAVAIVATADQFVAVGSDDGFPPKALGWVSTDGLTWQPAAVDSAPDGSQMTAVTTTSGGFVAVGTETSPGSGGPDRIAAWTSVDGLTWESAVVSRAARKGLGVGVRGVADGPAGLLALATFFGQDAGPFRLYQSLDGQAWQPVDLPRTKNVVWSSLVAIPDGYLLIGNTLRGKPSTFRSSDGLTWERVADAPRLLDAATGADGTIVGTGQHRIWVTQDLVDWQAVWRAPDVDAISEEDAILWVTWDGSQFAVSGVDYEACVEGVDECQRPWLMLSSDGTTWTASAGPDGVPGPDPGTWLADIASNGDATIVLGLTGPGPTVAWLMKAGGTSPMEAG